ncbi:MAG: YybS family protein [Selenomonadaceae bacterium]|nr:YybS family protein [Selenomonadaceae bacterium]
MNRNITPTIESGLLVAITVILGLVTVYVPILGMIVDFFFAVPSAVLTARQGAGKGLSALFVASILLSMLISPLFSLRLCLSVGICGVALGWCVRKNFNAVKIFFTTLIVASAAQVVSIALLSVVLDVNLIDTQLKMVRESFDESFQMYESMGVDKNRIAEAQTNLDAGFKILVFLIPTLLMLSALLNAAAVYLTSQWIFPKLRMKMPKMPPFAQWRFPSLFFYAAIVGGLCLYWGMTRGWVQIYEISLNVLILSLIIGLIQGFAVLTALANRFKLSTIFRGVMCVLLFLSPFMLQATAILGLVDMIFDYRKKFSSDGR